jgi:diguanylate cyclase (GGDEF)-like protein/PAS domain S-box-containing protein
MSIADEFTQTLQILQNLPAAVVQTDANWRITFVNAGWQAFTGYTLGDARAQSILGLVHADDHGKLRSGTSTLRLKFADGVTRPVQLRLHETLGDDGRVVSRSGVLAEISDAADAGVMSDRQRFLRLLETIDGVVWEAERGLGNTFLSSQVERLFGYTADEWRADPNFWRAHLHPDDAAAAIQIDDAAYASTESYGYEMHYRLMAKSGEAIWVRDLCRVVVEPEQPARMIGLMIDVSAQKRVEHALVQSETRYALAARGANDGIWDWDLRRDVLHVSSRFCEIVGLELMQQEHADGWRFLEPLIDADDRARVRHAFNRHVAGETATLSVDFRARHASARLRWVNWRGLAQIENGIAMRIAGSLSDLAERSSFYDSLTNLPGRPLFRDRLEHAIAMALAGPTKNEPAHDPTRTHCDSTMFAVLLLDLNGFKAVNDTLGHQTGDALLQQVARRLEANVRQADLVARTGGDEFVVLLESADLANAAARAHTIASALAVPYEVNGHTVTSGASIGVVSSEAKLVAVDEYLREADAAMYKAKTSGASVYTQR